MVSTVVVKIYKSVNRRELIALIPVAPSGASETDERLIEHAKDMLAGRLSDYEMKIAIFEVERKGEVSHDDKAYNAAPSRFPTRR